MMSGEVMNEVETHPCAVHLAVEQQSLGVVAHWRAHSSDCASLAFPLPTRVGCMLNHPLEAGDLEGVST